MDKLNSFYGIWTPRVLGLLRIVTGLLFMSHGAQKLFGFPAPAPMQFVLLSQVGLAAVLEFFGGLLILLGLFTRPAAFILSGEMAVAYFVAHARASFWPLVNRGELAVLYCFVFLFFATAGGGAWSLDGLIRSNKAETSS